MADLPSFSEFYRAVHGRDPFPWQARLADVVVESGWPADIGVPTGLGKTSTIDIAVWALAAQAGLGPRERRLPTRIYYVVDRRLLVDAASEHAERLAQRLGDPSAPAEMRAVGTALAGMSAVPDARTSRPLFVSRLRGGTPSGHRPPDPSQPAVICSTVAMYASRLLFRGYGSSRSMRPIDAAHAGIDSLVLLDEAHLAEPLQGLLGVLEDCDANRTGVLRFAGRHDPTGGPVTLVGAPRCYPRLVNLSATGRQVGGFDLDDSDRAHPAIAKRLAAAKPTRLVQTTAKDLPATLAACLRAELHSQAGNTAAVVFVNSPRTARAVATELGHDGGDLDVVVLTGQLRDPDAARVRDQLLDPVLGAPSGATPARDKPLVVVATQTLEVGADLDFDICVSETAGVRALIQRWGRLNRLGNKPDATGVLCHPADAEPGLYGEEPSELWARLTLGGVDSVELGPGGIADVLGASRDEPGRVGQLLPSHMWEFAKTSNPPVGAAPPEVFFDALDEPDRRVGVMWRSVLADDRNAVFPAPSEAEVVEVPIAELATLLEDGVEARRLSSDGITAEELTDTLRPGQRVILAAEAGGYGPSGWDPGHQEVVLDLSPLVRAALHLTPPALANILGEDPGTELADTLARLEFDPDDGPDPVADQQIADELGVLLTSRAAPPGTEELWPFAASPPCRIERLGEDQSPVLRWELPLRLPPARVDALDELSNSPRVGLYEHLHSVGELAERIATAIGLPPEVIAAAAAAGRLHDLGKADARFQRWLGNNDADTPVAKSAMTPTAWRRAAAAAGWPLGARHELLSVQLLDATLTSGGVISEPELVRHLVITHHGHGRPLCPTTTGDAAIHTDVTVAGAAVAAVTDPSAADWTQPDRFRATCEQHGYWGAALLESVLRQADHMVSAATEVI